MLLSYIIKYGKIIGMLASLVTVIGGLTAFSNYKYNQGYNAAVLGIQSDTNTLINEANIKSIEEAEIKIKKVLADQQLLHDAAIDRVRNDTKVEREIEYVYTEIDKIKYLDSDCNNVGIDFIGLLNKTIDTVNSTP